MNKPDLYILPSLHLKKDPDKMIDSKDKFGAGGTGQKD